jgi:hypothetical protein
MSDEPESWVIDDAMMDHIQDLATDHLIQLRDQQIKELGDERGRVATIVAYALGISMMIDG